MNDPHAAAPANSAEPLKRFNYGTFMGTAGMFEHAEGDFVRWKDVQALLPPAEVGVESGPLSDIHGAIACGVDAPDGGQPK